MSCRDLRAGFTLVELIATVVILGILTSIVGLAFHAFVSGVSDDEYTIRVRDARSEALKLRYPVSVEIHTGHSIVLVTAMPDGRMLEETADGAQMDAGIDASR